MPELLKVRTSDWELSIWCSDISKRQQAYRRTMATRGLQNAIGCELRFSVPVEIEPIADDRSSDSPPIAKLQAISLTSPIFFENMQYQFEWVFSCSDFSSAATEHKLKSVNDGFRFVGSKTGKDLPRLTGVINTGNDIGWLKLPWSYVSNGVLHHIAISFEVLPVKMDLHSDLPAMYKSIDSEFPLWRFSLAQKTEQSVTRSYSRGDFPLLWLAYFESLRHKFNDGLKVISNAPHSRLKPIKRRLKADRLKGKISNRLAERVATDLKAKVTHKHYQQNKKVLSVNTPENQFIKMVVDTTKQRLASFHHKLLANNKTPDKQRISESFLTAIHQWQQPLLRMQTQSFLREVGTFAGTNGESLVLQQKTGYSAVYKVWQELKFYLDIFSDQSLVSMKSVAAIYEIWCFLELRKILVEQLKFNEVTRKEKHLKLKDFEYQLIDGFSGSFHFRRSDGVTIRLAHEPVFGKKTKTIRTFWVTQRPDILMEVTFPNSRQCVFLFDAKYRIKSPDITDDLNHQGDEDSVDYVPEDALNQMHRYRDALIHIKTDSFSGESKSRSVFGAFALYPGFFDQIKDANPYDEVIKETGIGAFALLPSSNLHTGCTWLFDYLRSQIGLPIDEYAANKSSEALFVQEAARIPYYGMRQILYPNLVMTAALGGRAGRTSDYFQKFEKGNARFYHTKKSTFNSKYKQHVVQEIRFLAIAINSPNDPHTKIVRWVWPVKDVSVVPRNELSKTQAGSLSNDSEEYYLFELGKPFSLKDPIERVPHRPIRNTFKLTTLSLIENVDLFSDVLSVYEDALLS